MKVRVVLFAALRERAGRDALELEAPDGSTVAEVVQHARAACPQIAERPFATALNRRYAAPADVVQSGDELALIPPVSGG